MTYTQNWLRKSDDIVRKTCAGPGVMTLARLPSLVRLLSSPAEQARA